MARVRAKAETNFRHNRAKHLVHYIDLTPFIRNNTITHIDVRDTAGVEMNGEKLAVKHTLGPAHTRLIV